MRKSGKALGTLSITVVTLWLQLRIWFRTFRFSNTLKLHGMTPAHGFLYINLLEGLKYLEHFMERSLHLTVTSHTTNLLSNVKYRKKLKRQTMFNTQTKFLSFKK